MNVLALGAKSTSVNALQLSGKMPHLAQAFLMVSGRKAWPHAVMPQTGFEAKH